MSENPGENVTQSNGEGQPNTGTTLPPANTPQPNPAPPSQSVDLSGITTLLTALPETIAKAVKEAVGSVPAPTAPEKKTEEKTEEKKTEEKPAEQKPSGTPGKKTLSQWWFE